MKKTVHTRGLVLRRVGFSDSSQIVTLFTKDLGIATVLAKGALRLARRSSKFQAPFDLGGWYDVVFRRGGGDVHLATEARLVEGFDHLRRDPRAFLDACLVLDVLPRVLQPLDPHPEFLRSTLSYLKLLRSSDRRRVLRVHYYGQLLREIGLAPQWHACGECGAVLEDTGRFVLPMGALCSECARGRGRTLQPGTIPYLAAEQSAPWERVPGLAPGEALLSSAWRATLELLTYHLERPPRALRFLRD